MQVSAMVEPRPLRAFADLSERIARAHFDGIVVPETSTGPFLPLAAASHRSRDLELASGIALAFPRSPMTTAQDSWQLQELSGGRFRLGLGSQVKAHIERRYSAAYDPPGPRLRDYARAVKATFRSFAGEQKLNYQGEYYQLSLLPPGFAPGRIEHAVPPVDLAAVNPWMLTMAAEVADGVHLHPLHTKTYFEETVTPSLLSGLQSSGRAIEVFTVWISIIVVAGNDEERRRRREIARNQIAMYATTPSYGFMFDQIGASAVPDQVRAAFKSQQQDEVAKALPDEVLAHFIVDSDWDDLAAAIAERAAPLTGAQARITLYPAGSWDEPSYLERCGQAVQALRDLP